MATDNLIDVVEQLREIVQELKRTLYGDHATRSTGLLTEFDQMRRDVADLKAESEKMKKRPSVISWVLGYFSFCVATAFGMIALIDLAFVNLQIDYFVMGVPWSAAVWLAVLFALVALFLFVSGFGWLER